MRTSLVFGEREQKNLDLIQSRKKMMTVEEKKCLPQDKPTLLQQSFMRVKQRMKKLAQKTKEKKNRKWRREGNGKAMATRSIALWLAFNYTHKTLSLCLR